MDIKIIETLTDEIKSKAFSSGANLVGIISTDKIDAFPSHWIEWEKKWTKKTTDYMINSKSIIILGYRVWDDVHELVLYNNKTKEFPGYQRWRLYSRRVSRFLKEKGYKSVVYPELLSQKRMAQLAGLGNFGKNSLIINIKYGPWIRFQSILTDAEFIYDNPFEEDLCKDCEECIKACPVDALQPYQIDSTKCLLGLPDSEREKPQIKYIFNTHCKKNTKNSYFMCTTCQLACPYGREERGLL